MFSNDDKRAKSKLLEHYVPYQEEPMNHHKARKKPLDQYQQEQQNELVSTRKRPNLLTRT
jgi:hypothetical protein